MALPGREISVGWALFQWDGRIGRRVFILGTLFWMMANAAVIAFVTGSDDISPGSFSLFLTTASLSLVSLLMLGTKRLHDIGMPGMASFLLLLPPFFADPFLRALRLAAGSRRQPLRAGIGHAFVLSGG